MIVLYQSKTGFSERYAKVIAQKLGCDAVNIKTITPSVLREQDVVVYGSRVHAGSIDGLAQIKKWYGKGGIKSLVLFATGGTPNQAKDVVERIWSSNLTQQEQQSIPHFYMQSGICYERMGPVDRAIMKMAARMMKQKKDKNNTEEGFLQAIGESYDISGEEYAEPLVTYIKEKYYKE